MATKPLASTLPRWADTVAANPARVVEPPSGKKDIGWDVAERPPAQWKNWLLLQAYNWLVWLDAFETEAHTWTQLQTLQRGQTITQANANTRALRATGNGTAEGALFEGGTGGHGAIGQCFGPANYGLYGKGDPAGAASVGVRGEGGLNGDGGSFVGSGTGYGLRATGGGTSGIGGIFTGTGGLSGLSTTGNGSGWGAFCKGGATGVGVYGEGGSTSGRGGDFVGGGTSSAGLRATGGGTDGHGVEAIGTGTGYAVEAIGSIHTDLHVFADQTVAAGSGGSVNTMHASYSEFTTPTHAVAGSSIKDRVAPCNTARVLATITTDGAGNLTVQDDQGVSGAAIVGGNKIQINFVDAFAVAGKYQVSVTGYDSGTGGGNFAVIDADKNTGNVKVLCPSNPTTNALNFDIVCTGRQ
jgi:hypothetical protein